MEFEGVALIRVKIDAPSLAIANKKFQDDMKISSYAGVRREVMLDPELQEVTDGQID
jgi:hypothetical protein